MSLAVVVVAYGMTPSPGMAATAQQQNPDKLLTIAARVCPTYQDVTANRARNNIQESLRDLGADTTYVDGQAVDPQIEARDQPNCKPLPNWTFTLGTGIVERAVSGPWGSLSIVTNPFDTPEIVTEEHTPLLNTLGQPTGTTIDGATTIKLTPEQADLAASSSALWIQGGTPDDPILNEKFPGQFGFAALRCAEDNYNGDNVEWITYPAGTTHVFCFAYYVQPPPTSGRITIVKHVSSPAGATQTFPFAGNISFEPGGAFSLTVRNGSDDSIGFYRAETKPGDEPWSFRELVPPGWHVTEISCASATGGSSTTTDLLSASTSITLAAGDSVTCTYTDSLTPPPAGGLSLTKTTIGGVGTFDYKVTPSAGGTTTTATATTTTPGIPTAASPDTLSLAPGQYSIAESLPSAQRGKWTLTAVTCNGASLPASSPVTVTIPPGVGVTCNFENTFIPHGGIRIAKTAWGGTGTAGFEIFPVGNLPHDVVYTKTARVTQQGVATAATGDATNALPLGTYKIQEFAPAGQDTTGWALTSVICNGKLLAASQGAVTVTLTVAEPLVRCNFTNTFTPKPPTQPEPPPDPDPTPTADIRVNKTADRTTVQVGDTVTYTITVSNVGKAAAQGVNVAEQTPPATARILSLTPSQGTCSFDHRPASCDLGTLEAGHTATITAKVQATRVGALPNNVAVNSKTDVLRPPTDHVNGQARPRPKPKPKPGGFTG